MTREEIIQRASRLDHGQLLALLQLLDQLAGPPESQIPGKEPAPEDPADVK